MKIVSATRCGVCAAAYRWSDQDREPANENFSRRYPSDINTRAPGLERVRIAAAIVTGAFSDHVEQRRAVQVTRSVEASADSCV